MTQKDDSAEKSHEATPRKLEQARQKGEIPRSADLLTAAAYLGLLLGSVLAGPGMFLSFADALMPMVEQPDQLRAMAFGQGASTLTGDLLRANLWPIVPIFAGPAMCVLLVLSGTRGLTFTASKLAPKLSRLSLVENAKNKFGARGMFEFAKSFSKLFLYSACLAVFLSVHANEITGLSQAAPAEAMIFLLTLLAQFFTLVSVIALAIGGIDFFWQRGDHMRRNRMSQKELRDEVKESEGDPAMKNQRRSMAQHIALNQMMGDVPDADVVVVNPTHFAVALKWNRLPGSAPMCVAKGTDAIAARIRELAEQNAVPILSDPATARALFATTDIGTEVAPEHYRPVAAAIRFAEKMRRRSKNTGHL